MCVCLYTCLPFCFAKSQTHLPYEEKMPVSCLIIRNQCPRHAWVPSRDAMREVIIPGYDGLSRTPIMLDFQSCLNPLCQISKAVLISSCGIIRRNDQDVHDPLRVSCRRRSGQVSLMNHARSLEVAGLTSFLVFKPLLLSLSLHLFVCVVRISFFFAFWGFSFLICLSFPFFL